MAIQKKDSILTDYFELEKFKIDFPHFMIATLRKIKMASKKGTSKPFYNVQKGAPQQMPPQMMWGQMPGQFYPMAPFGANPQVGQGYQGKGKKQGIVGVPDSVYGQMGIDPQAQAKPQVNKGGQFNSIDDLIKNKAQFLTLSEAERGPLLKKLLTTKLQSYPKLVDV